MKKTHIAILCILVFIITIIVIGVFFGHLLVQLGLQHPPYYGQSPSEDATLFEKAEWEEHHGSICQCIIPIRFSGPIILHPGTDKSISIISFNLKLFPGELPLDMANASFTLSTKNAERTVRYDDPSANVSWNGSATDSHDTILNDNDLLHVDLNIEKMGFASAALGPGERFSLIITPSGWYRLPLTRTTPNEFSPGSSIEIP